MIARTLATLLWMTLLLGGPRPAAAQDETEPTTTSLTDSDEAREAASEHFRRAVELFQETHYRAALIEFERAYETLPDFRLHYNIAQTKRQLKDYVGAVQSYQRYLADGRDAVPEGRRTEVQEALQVLEGRTAHLTVSSNQDSVRIFVDDVLVGVTPITEPIAVNVGRHKVVARNSQGLESSELVDVAGGDTRSVHVPIEAGAVETADAPQEQPTETVMAPSREGSKATQRFAIAAMAIGGATVLGGVGAGVVAAVEQNNFDETLGNGMLGAATKHSRRAERSGLATDILVSTGLALTVSGMIVWLLKKPSKEKPATARKPGDLQWGIGPGSVSVQGAF